ncbi:cyclic AMP-dependent transcription factor ATF-6 alpha [Uranotaenia lowii]|uniref:cyclic AMP-dependent transcription factor ATF-6 alpha n=1 Tax=Uranotaenia lowii TaxID=190385 RepID=UPI00247988B6|nr:cyclic AMP-dependent transcription factor ATF-6 alpha [Uranotaenia lowii]
MEQQQLYDGTMLDIEPMLEDFPIDLYEGSPANDETFDTLDPNLLSHAIGSLDDTSCYSQEHDQMMSPQYGDSIDPDIFLNGVIKRESESSDCSNLSHRNTPSPADSNKSCESYPSSGYESCPSVQMNNILLDSAPVSPEMPPSPPQIVSVSSNKVIRVGAAHLPVIQKLSCPTKLSELKNIKLPQKTTFLKATGKVSQTVTKKTIVLTAKDYQALVKNIKSKTNGKILIKAASSINKKPMDTHVGCNQSTTVSTQSPLVSCSASAIITTIQEKKNSVDLGNQPGTASVPVASKERIIDERALKRHQRMIKNRESAFLSRARKKEYVNSLEQQIDALKQENQFLKTENFKLLEKLKHKCSCINSTVTRLGTVHTVISKRMTPNVRKNTAIVLAMLFMVSLNFGPIGNLLTRTSTTKSLMERNMEGLPHHQRNLLWLDDEPKLLKAAQNVATSLNITNLEDLSGQPEESLSACPFYVNQTENIRLASELRRWIGENGFKNLTDRDGDDMSINSFSEMFALKDTIDSMYRQMKDISSQMESFKRRNKIVVPRKNVQVPRKPAQQMDLYRDDYQMRKENDLALYYPGFSKKYAKFFEEIGRRDDTFYLVSFSVEHLLLPAIAYNKTNRPRMSLMLPAMMENATHPSDKVTLMQIDCEVMNTSMIQIREKNIPGDLLKPPPNSKSEYTASNPSSGTNRERTSHPFSGNNERNVSNAESTGKVPRYGKHQGSRPFFVQRMGVQPKDGLDVD